MRAAAKDKNAKLMRSLAWQMARVLLGKVKSYSGMDGWNEPGGIDVGLAEWCGVDETDPMKRVTGALLTFVNDAMDIAYYASKPGVGKGDWQWQVDALIQRYLFMLIGVSPANQTDVV